MSDMTDSEIQDQIEALGHAVEQVKDAIRFLADELPVSLLSSEKIKELNEILE